MSRVSDDEGRRLLDLLGEVIQRSGRSLRDIERTTGMSPGSLSHVMRGRTRLGFHHIERLGDELGFTLRDFLAYAGGDQRARRRVLAAASGLVVLAGAVQPPPEPPVERDRHLSEAEREEMRQLMREVLAEQLALLGLKPVQGPAEKPPAEHGDGAQPEDPDADPEG